ncbi:MAG: hypothetical protein ACOYIK_02225 [Coriobacteriales bacterium]|jgi:methyl-accepting chemotaxis protein
MSLSDLYAERSYCREQIGYWQNSADIYQSRMDQNIADIKHLEEQLRIANNALTKCQALTSMDFELTGDLMKVGNSIDSALDVSVGTLVQTINTDNADHIGSSINNCNTLIEELQAKLDQARADLEYNTEGRDYSNGRVSHYEDRLSAVQSAIDNWDDDDD